MSGLLSGLSIGFLVMQTTVNSVPTPSLFDVALKNAFVGNFDNINQRETKQAIHSKKSKGGEKINSTCQCN
jgi:hypothetical protein